jgi:RecJ-like exonuclease
MTALTIGLSCILVASILLNLFQYLETCNIQGENYRLRDQLEGSVRHNKDLTVKLEVQSDRLEKLKDTYAMTATRAVHAERDYRNVRAAHVELLDKIAAGTVIDPAIVQMFTNQQDS